MKEGARRELRRYTTGAALSAALTLLAFWAVMGAGFDRWSALWTLGIAAVLQVVVQLRCFLHIGWHSKRRDLYLILFTFLLLTLMIGGTIWIMSNLATRMY